VDPGEGAGVKFTLEARSGEARAGRLETRAGAVETPAFMPVATQGSVKTLSAADVERTGAQMVIMNTYHLWVRPGAELVKAQGGLHELSRWRRPIVTDSGGFQAFSLAERVKLSEEGFAFASHLDGQKLVLSPEVAMQIQADLGSDIAMQLDVCPAGGCSKDELELAVQRTTRWAERCLAAKRGEGQAVFGIVQGGSDVDLRRAHARELERMPFDGLALGGFSVGEPAEEMHRTLAQVAPGLDPARPHYLMGVGTPEDLVRAIGAGIDLFDCVMPTRNARNGQAFTLNGRVVIKNARNREERAVLEHGCPCEACSGGYSRAFLRHLFLAGEILALRLLTLHNLTFYARLVSAARRAVLDGTYDAWAEETQRSLRPA
jgi:queuine tRNA-ribosyltransferase